MIVSPRPAGRRTEASLSVVLCSLLLSTLAAGPATAQSTADVVRDVRAYRAANEVAIVEELVELVSIPNFAEDEVNIRRNARFLIQQLERRGARAELLESPGSPPAVLGHLPANDGASDHPTIVFYAHYDGQPVDESRWWSDPYVAELRAGMNADAKRVDLRDLEAPIDPELRLFGRSASDDKAPIVAMLRALDALEAAGIPRSVDLKFFFEGEEERGSPHLAEMLETHKSKLDADLWLFCDGPVHQSRRQQVVFGVRGVMGLGITLYGPNRPLHSGHYGNWAPNPAARLTELLAGMRDGEGRILIEGFYDDVRELSAVDRAAIAEAPDIDSELREDLALGASEAGNAPLLERILLPALNVQGLSAGMVGERAQNAVPSVARAAVGFRLVPDLTPEKIRELVERHLRTQGYHLVYTEPDAATRRAHERLVQLDWEGGYRATRTALDGPEAEALLEVVDQVVAAQTAMSTNGDGPERSLRLPILGGSLPLYLFEEILQTPLIVLPMVNHDNSQHAPNENLRIQNLWDGIELYAAVIAGLDAW